MTQPPTGRGASVGSPRHLPTDDRAFPKSERSHDCPTHPDSVHGTQRRTQVTHELAVSVLPKKYEADEAAEGRPRHGNPSAWRDRLRRASRTPCMGGNQSPGLRAGPTQDGHRGGLNKHPDTKNTNA